MNFNTVGVQNQTYDALAEKYGTPFYVYDAQVITDTYRDLRSQLPSEIELFYSLKANPNVSIYALLASLGARAEVCSLVELETALCAGTSPDSILFVGPAKSEAELERAIDKGILALVAESFEELVQINRIAAAKNKMASVLLRINPLFQVKNAGLTMGGKPRQFGMDEAQIAAMVPELKALPRLRVLGIHVYMGTRILDHRAVVENTTRILELAERMEALLETRFEMIDIGGGLGVPYFEKESDPDITALGEELSPLVASFRIRHPQTRLFMELGRYLVGKSGVFVSKVRYSKDSMGKRFLITDGGSNCHMAAVGIGSFVRRNFPIRRLGAEGPSQDAAYTITGPLCTPNDVMGEDVALPLTHAGDLIGVFHSGAYGPTASPVRFLSHGYPAEVLVHRGNSHLIRSRDTLLDFLGKQSLVEMSAP